MGNLISYIINYSYVNELQLTLQNKSDEITDLKNKLDSTKNELALLKEYNNDIDFSNNINDNEKIKVIKYYLNDKINNISHQYIVYEPYNFIIYPNIDLNLSIISKNWETDINERDEIEISKKWIDECYKIYIKEKYIQRRKKELLETEPKIKGNFEISVEAATKGINLYKEKKYVEAINILNRYNFRNNIYQSYIYYILTCCHSLNKDKENTIKYLSKCIESGASNSNLLLNDDNLKEYKDTDEFTQILNKIKKN